VLRYLKNRGVSKADSSINIDNTVLGFKYDESWESGMFLIMVRWSRCSDLATHEVSDTIPTLNRAIPPPTGPRPTVTIQGFSYAKVQKPAISRNRHSPSCRTCTKVHMPRYRNVFLRRILPFHTKVVNPQCVTNMIVLKLIHGAQYRGRFDPKSYTLIRL
jgi:hypothetical protein